MEEKYCSKCERTLSTSLFGRHKSRKDGLQTHCKECRNTKQRQYYKDVDYYAKHKDQYDETKKNHQKVLRGYVSLVKESGCSKCPETHPATLDFHHRNPSEKSFSIGLHGRISLEKLKEEINKCDIVCANCHRILHYEENIAD